MTKVTLGQKETMVRRATNETEVNVGFLVEPAGRMIKVTEVREDILDLLVIKATKVIEGPLGLLGLLGVQV